MRLIVPAALLALSMTSGCIAVSTSTVEAAPAPATVTAPPQAASSVSTLTRSSDTNFAATEERLRYAIERRGLTLFTVIDHSAGAASINMELEPNKVFVFGNPKAGTPLMQTNPSLGLELPLKAAIYEKDGVVMVSVSDIRHLTLRHGIIEPPQVIANIERALLSILEEAAGTAG